ncbi:winged helix-turn-helix transcriptional regulator [Candidatus Kuenenbacteria bacterium]|nr:winged helix-turn-helix transcriptional regulator [Candidatus Kuenenbacteria bacterium]
MALTQELLAIGLTDKEAEVFVSALQLGYASVHEIAQKSGINRTTTYTHVKNLIARGLINVVEKNGKVFYVAEKPEKLKYIYEQQEKEIQRRRQTLDKIMPELESIYNLAKNRPSVRYYSYTDKNDLDYVRREIQNQRSSEVYNIFNHDLFSEHINRNHIQAILDSVQKFRILYISKNKILDRKVHPFIGHEKLKLKFLPEAKFNFLSEVLISDCNVYIAGNGSWMVISDKLFSQTLTLLFHALWGIAEDF